MAGMSRGRQLTDAELDRFAAGLTLGSTRQGRFERALRLLVRLWCRLVGWRIEVVGRADLPVRGGVPGAGCVVAVAPHRAWVEPFLLFAAWPEEAARLAWLADGHTVTRSWWRRRVLPRVGVIPVSGKRSGPKTYAAMTAAALAAGRALVIFPEVGPPSPPDRARKCSAGFAYLALGAGAPVVPVVVGGTHRIVRGSHFSLDFLAAEDPGRGGGVGFDPATRRRAHELRERVEASLAQVLPRRTAQADATAPEDERWRWLGSLFG